MELIPKGKPAKDSPGPFSVIAVFSDGTDLTVCRGVDDKVAVEKMKELVTGIGARVGTTKQVHITDDIGNKMSSWVYKNHLSL